MATISEELLAIEKEFWTGGKAYYEEHIDKECLVAFPDMAGAMGNADIAATVKEGNRWQDLNLEAVDAVKPSQDVTIITYNVKARRANGEPYAALVSSGYVKRPDGWKMMFHAQTPLDTSTDN